MASKCNCNFAETGKHSNPIGMAPSCTARCEGFNVSGYWKGKPCGTSPTIQDGKNWWCATHYAVHLTNPERFDKARESWERKLQKQSK